MLHCRTPALLLMAYCLLVDLTTTSHAFHLVVHHHSSLRIPSCTSYGSPPCAFRIYSKNGDGEDKDGTLFDTSVLQQRLMQIRSEVLEEEFQQPPNPKLSAKEFIREILHALWNSSEPLPDAGFRVLLRSATRQWKNSLYQSVGAPPSANEEVVASALGETIGRPNNQFAILVAEDDETNGFWNEDLDIPYLIEFPSEEVDYGDGTCWVEYRLRSKQDSTLYVAMGWQLHQRETDGAWLIDHIDWQDFREQFRPGIGREEWMRICG